MSLGSSSKHQGARQASGLLVGKHQPSESHGTRDDLLSKAVERCPLGGVHRCQGTRHVGAPPETAGDSMGVVPTCLHPGE